jgi:hypothetical protein
MQDGRLRPSLSAASPAGSRNIHSRPVFLVS